MPEKSLSDRVDDCETFQGSQQTEIQDHSGRIRELEDGILKLQDEVKEQKEQFNALREDLKIVIKYSGELQHAILNAASGPGLDDLKKFRDKYGIRIG